MSYEEFISLLSGIMPETPLGRIVSIRSEKDRKVINSFSNDQKRIYSDWKMRQAEKMKKNRNAYAKYWERMQNDLKNAFLRK